jgi:hypothetical protein
VSIGCAPQQKGSRQCVAHLIGLVVSKRFPIQPAIAALLQEAHKDALGTPSRA